MPAKPSSKPKITEPRDLLILGGGLVGMTLALAAAKKGITSHVVDRADPASLTADGFDGRASAIARIGDSSSTLVTDLFGICIDTWGEVGSHVRGRVAGAVRLAHACSRTRRDLVRGANSRIRGEIVTHRDQGDLG